MALKLKTDSAHFRDLNFDFLGFDGMELFQPTAVWGKKMIPGTQMFAPLNVGDLKMDEHFTKRPISDFNLEPKLKEFLKSFTPTTIPNSVYGRESHKIQSAILKVSSDIIDMKGVLRSTHRKYKQEYHRIFH